MSDIIRLLPDSVANQIAAGEVIQRPASAVKELLENSVDAGATRIQLVVSDAGKTLIQVIDNGRGMTENDARMCFERHATSKITSADDLFALRTKGFRGEAMASIAAVAQVEMKTRPSENELGTRLQIEGSRILKQEPCHCPYGTNISVKNLFFNVPARRNFLKSNPVEMRHIMDEFTRVALAHTDLEMSLMQDGDEIFHCKSGNLRQRIVELFGKAFNEKLVPIAEETSIAAVSGFIGKPEFARKTRGEQFFFVNDRFIRSNYLSHAVSTAYDELVADRSHPAYFIFLHVDPSFIDINIHPTKTEVKFEDEKSVYAILRSAVRQSLGKYNISPTLDFDQEMSIQFPPPPKNVHVVQPEIQLPGHRPIVTKAHSDGMRKTRTEWTPVPDDEWQKLYEGLPTEMPHVVETTYKQAELSVEDEAEKHPLQIHGKYILTSIRSGTIIIDQKRAHQRIIYENIIRGLAHHESPSQQLLFPVTLEFNASESKLLTELLQEVRMLGIELEPFGQNAFIVQGLAPFLEGSSIKEVIDGLLEEYTSSGSLTSIKRQERMAQALARQAAIQHGKRLQPEEMKQLIDELFACDNPYVAPNGKPTLITLPLEEIDKRFA